MTHSSCRYLDGWALPVTPKLARMHNGDKTITRRLVAGALALAVGGTLAACRTADTADNATGPAPAAAPSAAAADHFGPDRYGKIMLGMSEQEALATGDLQTEPVATVLGKNVYSFVGGPRPNPKQMAADEKTEEAVEKADKSTDTSAAGSAKAAEAYAQSAQRIVDRLEAYLGYGGVAFKGGKMVSIAAPEDAVTEAGIKRGSTVAELTAAYDGRGLKKSSKTAYELPVDGKPGWTVLFEIERDAVKYLSIGQAG